MKYEIDTVDDENINFNLPALASLANQEDWGENYDILLFYIQTTLKAYWNHHLFHTGLLTSSGEWIYGVFDYTLNQWEWITNIERANRCLKECSKPNYTTRSICQTIFFPDVDRCIDYERIRTSIQPFMNNEIDPSWCHGAVSKAIFQASVKQKPAVSLFFKNQICLGLPIINHDKVIAVLLLQPCSLIRNPSSFCIKDWVYVGSTVISLKMAYQCARLLSPVESRWLLPRYKSI